MIKLAKEQGYLTFDDLNEALPEGITDADELDLILTRLRRLEIDIIEASEVDRYKDGKKDTEEELEEEERTETKVDILDDPVRMYLKQMGQVPLLTREQEVEISKRIEEAEDMVLKHINRFGFIAQAHLDLATKLIEGRERFDRVILDKKIESRERYMKNLPRLCKQVEQLSASISRQFCEVARNSLKKRPPKLRALQRMMTSLQRLYPLFYLKQKVTEEFVHLADDAHHTSLYLQTELAKNPRSKKRRLQLQSKIRELEKGLWFPLAEYAKEYQTLKGWMRQAFKAKTEGGREIRVSARVQVFHLRHVVDSPGNHPLDRRPGPHDSHPGPYDRDDQQTHACAETAGAGIRTRTHARGSGRRSPPASRSRAVCSQDGAATNLAPVSGR